MGEFYDAYFLILRLQKLQLQKMEEREMLKATNYFMYRFVSHKAYHNKIISENGK